MTAYDLIADAMKGLGVLAAGETLQAEDAADGLRRLNEWMDSLALERLTTYHLLRTVVPIVNGRPSYTIGLGGQISIVRPTDIIYCNLLRPSP